MIGLKTLGYDASEIHPAAAHADGRLCVPTTWYGLDGYFLVSTSLRLDICLNGSGVDTGNVPLLRDRDEFSVHAMEDFSLLGRLRPAAEVTAYKPAKSTNVFGRVGARFFEGATLALDPAEPSVAVGEWAWQPPRPADYDRFPHIGESRLPLTDLIRFADAPQVPVMTLFASDRSTSCVSSRFMQVLGRRKFSRRWRTCLVLPSGREFDVTVEPRAQPRYASDSGVPAIDLVIGMDLLRRGYTVLDWIDDVTWFGHYEDLANR